MDSQPPLKRKVLYLLPAVGVAILAALACAAVSVHHIQQARTLPVSTDTLRQGLRQDLIEGAVAIVVAAALALLVTAAVLARSRPATVTLALLALVAFYLSAWPIQAVADATTWAHHPAVRFVPMLTAWAAVPLALVVARISRQTGRR